MTDKAGETDPRLKLEVQARLQQRRLADIIATLLRLYMRRAWRGCSISSRFRQSFAGDIDGLISQVIPYQGDSLDQRR